jgi:pimeloyl-ACP methyl ester carboxylesterase
MISLGSGPPIVMVPGIQGRWQWQRPALEALATRSTAITYSLCGEPGSGCRLRSAVGFDVHVDQLDRVLDAFGLDRVALCGVSYGGWVSVRYAARRPERVSALVLASAPGPRFGLDLRQSRYLRRPWSLFPGFVVRTRQQLRPEILRAVPDDRERWRLTRRLLREMARAPISPGTMSRRMQLALREDFVPDCEAIDTPTLVLTGEDGLDRIVPVASTRDYLRHIRGAVAATLPDTGHIGLVTRARAWADIVCDFVDATRDAAAPGDLAAVADFFAAIEPPVDHPDHASVTRSHRT